LNRVHKRFVFLLIDVVLAPLALYVCVMLVYASVYPSSSIRNMWQAFVFLPMVAAALSAMLGIPNIKLKAYESLAILRTAAFAAALSVFLFALTRMSQQTFPFPLMGVSLFGLIFFLASVGIRVAMLNLYLWVLRWGHRRWRILIYGAGTTGIQLAAALKSHEQVVVVAFLDDNIALQSMSVAGLRVLSPDRIEAIVKEREIDRVLLAMPSVSPPAIAGAGRAGAALVRATGRGRGAGRQSGPGRARQIPRPQTGGRGGTRRILGLCWPVGAGQRCGRHHRVRTVSATDFLRSKQTGALRSQRDCPL
jgi:hypothetical protein